MVETLLPCHLVDHGMEAPHEPFMLFPNVQMGWKMLPRDHQEMHRSLWIHILKADNLLVLIEDLAGNLLLCNLTEET